MAEDNLDKLVRNTLTRKDLYPSQSGPKEAGWEMSGQQEAADRRSQAEAQAQQPKQAKD